MQGDLLHHAYPTLTSYIEHMNRYSSLSVDDPLIKRRLNKLGGFFGGTIANPLATFLYNYTVRGGFLDGREGLLLHFYNSCYVSWKYAKTWEAGRLRKRPC